MLCCALDWLREAMSRAAISVVVGGGGGQGGRWSADDATLALVRVRIVDLGELERELERNLVCDAVLLKKYIFFIYC